MSSAPAAGVGWEVFVLAQFVRVDCRNGQHPLFCASTLGCISSVDVGLVLVVVVF